MQHNPEKAQRKSGKIQRLAARAYFDFMGQK